MQISHNTIYRELYLQGRDALRTDRARWRPKGPNPGRGKRGKLKDVAEISDRPAEVEDRTIPGHWEGDLLMERASRSQVGVIVEHSSRFIQLVARSLTWGRGREMAEHVRFTVDTGVDVYYCDPYSPGSVAPPKTRTCCWQYLPWKLDLSTLSQEELDRIATELNDRLRETLDWQTPA